MSNILFVLYHDFTANSAVQVHNFANQLASFGHGVAVAVPDNRETVVHLGERAYAAVTFPECDGTWAGIFSNGQGPDIVHAWTPRENVRLFCEKLKGLASFALIIHLEDNEELILEANLGSPFEELASSRTITFPGNLSHPRNYPRFLASAAGVTVIMDRLAKFAPPNVPKHILWPGADRDLFFPRPKDEALLADLGIPRGAIVLCYTGNTHSANFREVRSLYVAVAILNREGIPATMVRAGSDHRPFLGSDETWARRHTVELGYVEHVNVPPLLSLADFLIQPGAADEFNEYRLPAKLPEFFAMGRPVILPHTNVGRFVRHGEDAWVLPKVDALGIVNALQTLRRHPSLATQLAAGAVAYCDQHFDWEKNAATLDGFYAQLLANKGSRTREQIGTVP